MRVTVDERGRVQLPADVRRDAHIEAGNEVDVSADALGQSIIILPIPPRCASCGTQKGLLAEYGRDPARTICPSCADAIACCTLVFDASKKG